MSIFGVLLFVSFPLRAVISSGFYLYVILKPGSGLADQRHRFASLTIAYVLTYVLCFVLAALNPYWIDNQSRVSIGFPDYFTWALLGAMFFQFITVPIFFIGSVVTIKLFKKFRRIQ